MNLNGVEDRVLITLHHESVLGAYTPQRYGGCREPVVNSILATYSAARPDIMQREVAERVDDFVAERSRNGEGSAIDDCARGGRCEATCMAHGAANLVEQCGAGVYVSRDRSASRSPQRPHEICEGFDVISVILRVRYRIKRSG